MSPLNFPRALAHAVPSTLQHGEKKKKKRALEKEEDRLDNLGTQL